MGTPPVLQLSRPAQKASAAHKRPAEQWGLLEVRQHSRMHSSADSRTDVLPATLHPCGRRDQIQATLLGSRKQMPASLQPDGGGRRRQGAPAPGRKMLQTSPPAAVDWTAVGGVSAVKDQGDVSWEQCGEACS